jgi:hypothetical protein
MFIAASFLFVLNALNQLRPNWLGDSIGPYRAVVIYVAMQKALTTYEIDF